MLCVLELRNYLFERPFSRLSRATVAYPTNSAAAFDRRQVRLLSFPKLFSHSYIHCSHPSIRFLPRKYQKNITKDLLRCRDSSIESTTTSPSAASTTKPVLQPAIPRALLAGIGSGRSTSSSDTCAGRTDVPRRSSPSPLRGPKRTTTRSRGWTWDTAGCRLLKSILPYCWAMGASSIIWLISLRTRARG